MNAHAITSARFRAAVGAPSKAREIIEDGERRRDAGVGEDLCGPGISAARAWILTHE